ncbi:hypothetical protein GQR58_012223 [Nymphon striatum]|nr:hypothetical protein GQR58_012223 [Nymphon striatum]
MHNAQSQVKQQSISALFYEKTTHNIHFDIFSYRSGPEACLRCMVITQNHHNILQYRETHCHPHGTFRELCSMISSDQELYPMFRVDADPIPCPIRGPFTFTYSRSGKGVCSNPVSRAEACVQDSKLQFRFQACVDVRGSQSSVETLTCLATWKEGPVSYLIGKLDHKMVSTDDDRFRCFVYENVRRTNELVISQSEDATCNGLRESADGDRVMNLIPDNSIKAGCSFPKWVTKYKHWQKISSNITYVFTSSTFSAATLSDHPTRYTEYHIRFLCRRNISKSENNFRAITHITIGCNQAYSCVSFKRRQEHILEITSGRQVENIEDACKDEGNFNKSTVLLAVTSYQPKIALAYIDLWRDDTFNNDASYSPFRFEPRWRVNDGDKSGVS